MKKIKIIGASSPHNWYIEYIGKELNVEDESPFYYITKFGNVKKQDAIVCDNWHTIHP